MENEQKCTGLVLVHLATMDIYDTFNSDISSIRRLASIINELREFIIVNTIAKEEKLDSKEMTYNDINAVYYKSEHDTKAKSILRNIVKRTYEFMGSPGGKISSMNISKSSLVDIINRTSLFLIVADRYARNKANIERRRKI